MINMYTRTPRFKDCINAFVEYGLEFRDKALLSVLLDDAILLENYLKEEPEIITAKYPLACAYTSMQDVTLLHICAEYNHLACGKILVSYGADINQRAGIDEFGFGGQTPVFHMVNQNQHNSAEMLAYLLSQSVD